MRGKSSYYIQMIGRVLIFFITLNSNNPYYFLIQNHRAENKRLGHFPLYHYYFLYILFMLLCIVINKYFFAVFNTPYRKVIFVVHRKRKRLTSYSTIKLIFNLN